MPSEKSFEAVLNVIRKSTPSSKSTYCYQKIHFKQSVMQSETKVEKNFD